MNQHQRALEILWRGYARNPTKPASLRPLILRLGQLLEPLFPPTLCRPCLRGSFLPWAASPLGTLGRLVKTAQTTPPLTHTVNSLETYLFSRIMLLAPEENQLEETLLLLWGGTGAPCVVCNKPVLCEQPREVQWNQTLPELPGTETKPSAP
jgi:hypothetical protein